MNARNRVTDRRRTGFSLLEVVAASALTAMALVPALAILRDGMELSRVIDNRQMLLLYGISKLEEHLALSAATWPTGTSSGDFSSDGHADIRFSVTRSDSPADGGIVDGLMAITVTTYHDADGDDALDVGEQQLVLTSKVGKFVSYESEAGN